MNILAQLHEYHGKARILAHGHPFLFCNPGILLQLLQYLNPQRGFLFLHRSVEGLKHILLQISVSLHTESPDFLSNHLNINLSHRFLTFYVIARSEATKQSVGIASLRPEHHAVQGFACNDSL